ncbi:MAG: hypothetical protein CMD15_03340 [Flavobacteriales bacterium]|nr:hypothetical protein [Flavobacteriales bacterium]|tara:strand:- start:23589 stop:24764 length:1176 start_codon:yes stop_codon:yes gene_type:complete
MEYIILILLIILIIIAAINFKINQNSQENSEKENLEILQNDIIKKEEKIKNLEEDIKILDAKMTSFEQIKTEKTQLNERLKIIEQEKNNLKNEVNKLINNEENRNETLRKSIASTNTLQQNLQTEIARVNDERVKKEKELQEKMKKSWSDHEKDVQRYIQLICNNHVIKYIGQEDFPYPRNKPDNCIEIMDQLIVFDAKSPANDDLSNFPKYLKDQTENLKKYAKHESVKKDLFLVIPSNTLSVISQYTYNIGGYNVNIITKDSLEPIILSLKKIEEYEFADKLSPEERDNICRIIGKFAHTTKRRIQIDQFFANEFLDTLSKTGSLLPREILESVIQFENAEKLNPPMEKRKKQILTKELKNQSEKIKKEIELREIPDIEANIEFKNDKK